MLKEHEWFRHNKAIKMTSIVVPFTALNSRLKRFCNLTKFAKKIKLNISTQDEVGSNFIALDIVKRKLLYANRTLNSSSYLIVDLSKLKACTIRKEYNPIDAGELKTKKLHQFLKRVFLKLVFKDGSKAVSLPLFDAQKEGQQNIEHLEIRARKWENLVSKFLPVQIGQRT
jgi:hypothetical protein